MQGAAVKTAAPHSAIFLILSGVGRFWLLPYFRTEHQVIVHRLMKLFLQTLRILRLEVHHIVDAEESSALAEYPLYVIAACFIVQNRSLCVPVLDRNSTNSFSLT